MPAGHEYPAQSMPVVALLTDAPWRHIYLRTPKCTDQGTQTPPAKLINKLYVGLSGKLGFFRINNPATGTRIIIMKYLYPIYPGTP
jgi:hypothetical protein